MELQGNRTFRESFPSQGKHIFKSFWKFDMDQRTDTVGYFLKFGRTVPT